MFAFEKLVNFSSNWLLAKTIAFILASFKADPPLCDTQIVKSTAFIDLSILSFNFPTENEVTLLAVQVNPSIEI